MSGIDEARERYGDAVIDYYDRAEGRPDAMNAAFNMLVLAIRAELPCLSPPTGLTGRPHGGDCGLCLTCEAREARKETRGR